jgi:hypothetical protein
MHAFDDLPFPYHVHFDSCDGSGANIKLYVNIGRKTLKTTRIIE